MKILILTEGGKEAGFGHLTRCIALAQGIREYIDGKNTTCQFIVNGDASVNNMFEPEGFKVKIKDWVKKYRALEPEIKKADLTIIDSYLAPKALYNRISRISNGRILMIDDYKRIEYPAGFVVNPLIYGDKLNYPQKDSVRYLLGKDYVILRKEFWTVPEKKVNKKMGNILIAFGRTDSAVPFYRIIIDYIKKNFYFKLDLIQPQKAALNAKEILNLMQKSDISVSAGGQTTYELARVGIPGIGICFSENQIRNLKAWQKKGFIEDIGWHNDANLPGKLKEAFNRLLPYEERVKRSKIGRASVDGKGVERILRSVL